MHTHPLFLANGHQINHSLFRKLSAVAALGLFRHSNKYLSEQFAQGKTLRDKVLHVRQVRILRQSCLSQGFELPSLLDSHSTYMTFLVSPHTLHATYFTNETLFLTSIMLILTGDKILDVHWR